MKKLYLFFLIFICNISFSLDFIHIAHKYYEKGKIASSEHRREDAYKNFTMALKYDTSNPLIYFEMALILDYFNNTSLAIDYYKKALKLKNNNFPQALFNLAFIYKREKEYSKAIKYFKILISKYSDKLAESQLNEIYKSIYKR